MRYVLPNLLYTFFLGKKIRQGSVLIIEVNIKYLLKNCIKYISTYYISSHPIFTTVVKVVFFILKHFPKYNIIPTRTTMIELQVSLLCTFNHYIVFQP